MSNDRIPFRIGLRGIAYRGYRQHYTVGNPAAGASGATWTVDGGMLARVWCISFRYACSAVVGSRQLTVQYRDGDGNIWARFSSAGVQTANQDFRYSFYVNLADARSAFAEAQVATIGEAFLEPGESVRINVAGPDATDQLSVITVVAERWLIGPYGYPIGLTTEEDFVEKGR